MASLRSTAARLRHHESDSRDQPRDVRKEDLGVGAELESARQVQRIQTPQRRRGPSSQRALAAALDVSPRNVTGQVDALEERGFVRREPHPTDRRITLVTLTEQGVRTTAEMAKSHREIAAHLVAGFDADRLEQFRTDLGTIAGRLHELMDPEARS